MRPIDVGDADSEAEDSAIARSDAEYVVEVRRASISIPAITQFLRSQSRDSQDVHSLARAGDGQTRRHQIVNDGLPRRLTAARPPRVANESSRSAPHARPDRREGR